MQDDLKSSLGAHHAEFTTIGRDIHAHPELGMEEERTAALVAEKLRGCARRRAARISSK